MILTFGDRATADLYHGENSRWARRYPPDVIPVALRKLDLLNAAAAIGDLRAPPGNRLEALKGKWKGRYSIRVNDQWRLVFRWRGANSLDVILTDYHD